MNVLFSFINQILQRLKARITKQVDFRIAASTYEELLQYFSSTVVAEQKVENHNYVPIPIQTKTKHHQVFSGNHFENFKINLKNLNPILTYFSELSLPVDDSFHDPYHSALRLDQCITDHLDSTDKLLNKHAPFNCDLRHLTYHRMDQLDDRIQCLRYICDKYEKDIQVLKRLREIEGQRYLIPYTVQRYPVNGNLFWFCHPAYKDCDHTSHYITKLKNGEVYHFVKCVVDDYGTLQPVP